MGSVKHIARGQTHVGRVRAVNQDSFLVDDVAQLFIVADGMGGHAGGEIASKLCITLISEYLSSFSQQLSGYSVQGLDPKIHSILSDSVNHASAKIYEHALEEPSLKGMGTTATVIKIVGSKAYCAHVGDSRMYLIRSNYLYQVSYDHSLVNEQVRAGVIAPEDAENHHLKNVITRSVGYQEEEDVDTMTIDLESGDFLLLCSDGLHGKVLDKEIAQMVRSYHFDAVSKLIDLANERGGEDNITAVLIQVEVEAKA